MEPAGRYFWHDFKAFLSPAFGTWRRALRTIYKATLTMIAAVCIGLAFAVAAWHKRGNWND